MFCSQSDEQNGLWHELQGDYYIPCLVLDEEETQPIGMWGKRYLRYDYARMHDIVSKDYSEFVDISRYNDQNPNKRDRTHFIKDEIKRLWELAEDLHYQIILMLIYNGCRISEFLDLKKEHLHLAAD